MVIVAADPQLLEYVITVVPVETPETMPVLLPIVATAVLLLVQAPLVAVLVRVMFEPGQTLVAPEIPDGVLFTVSVADAAVPQPFE